MDFQERKGCSPMGRHPISIAVLSFNRPEYLRQVMESLVAQLIDGDEIYMFQDGGWNNFSEIEKASDTIIDSCVGIFPNSLYKKSIELNNLKFRVFMSHDNCGIAGNYRRAEQYLFSKLKKNMHYSWRTISFWVKTI